MKWVLPRIIWYPPLWFWQENVYFLRLKNISFWQVLATWHDWSLWMAVCKIKNVCMKPYTWSRDHVDMFIINGCGLYSCCYRWSVNGNLPFVLSLLSYEWMSPCDYARAYTCFIEGQANCLYTEYWMQTASAKTIFIFPRYSSFVWSTCDSFSNSQPLSAVYPEWMPAVEDISS